MFSEPLISYDEWFSRIQEIHEQDNFDHTYSDVDKYIINKLTENVLTQYRVGYIAKRIDEDEIPPRYATTPYGLELGKYFSPLKALYLYRQELINTFIDKLRESAGYRIDVIADKWEKQLNNGDIIVVLKLSKIVPHYILNLLLIESGRIVTLGLYNLFQPQLGSQSIQLYYKYGDGDEFVRRMTELLNQKLDPHLVYRIAVLTLLCRPNVLDKIANICKSSIEKLALVFNYYWAVFYRLTARPLGILQGLQLDNLVLLQYALFLFFYTGEPFLGVKTNNTEQLRKLFVKISELCKLANVNSVADFVKLEPQRIEDLFFNRLQPKNIVDVINLPADLNLIPTPLTTSQIVISLHKTIREFGMSTICTLAGLVVNALSAKLKVGLFVENQLLGLRGVDTLNERYLVEPETFDDLTSFLYDVICS